MSKPCHPNSRCIPTEVIWTESILKFWVNLSQRASYQSNVTAIHSNMYPLVQENCSFSPTCIYEGKQKHKIIPHNKHSVYSPRSKRTPIPVVPYVCHRHRPSRRSCVSLRPRCWFCTATTSLANHGRPHPSFETIYRYIPYIWLHSMQLAIVNIS